MYIVGNEIEPFLARLNRHSKNETRSMFRLSENYRFVSDVSSEDL